MRSSLKFHTVNKDTSDMDRDLAKIQKRLMKRYDKIFKDELDKNDHLNIDPIKLKLIDNHRKSTSQIT